MLQLAQNTPPEGSGDTVHSLNQRLQGATAPVVLQYALSQMGRVALVSSFGAEAAVLLHMVAQIDRAAPVLFIDTELLFPETLSYQQALTDQLGLTAVTTLRSADITAQDPDNTLHQTDPDACCALRKTAPLQSALAGFDGWITGRKRYQSGRRATLETFETDGPRIKINPLVSWTPARLRLYMEEHALPPHPLVARGYPSIGCAPCTSPVAEGEDPRAGRWKGQTKDECGIHFENGRIVPLREAS